MTTLHNEIVINAPIEKIWDALTDIERLDKFDPTVKKSTAITQEKSGIGAKRKVDMLDGKNWFEEKVTSFKQNEGLEYELTACSFPVHKLKHTYSFEKIGGQIKVKQVMQYQMKFGLLGKLMDAMMVRKKSDSGIKQFMAGLKDYSESK
jgi:ribosome-associated toxin RatA of RatAB toxin-antitoxin module